MKKVLFFLVIVCCCNSSIAQAISGDIKSEVVENLIDLIREKYVYEDIAYQIVDSLANRTYMESNCAEFAGQLSRDLKNFSDDKHFEVACSTKLATDTLEIGTGLRPDLNYGFTKLEILKGNIGYLKINYFEDPKYAGPLVHSTMSFLENADGLIIDLRDNNGGKKGMVQLLLSYFFEASSEHLYTIYGRDEIFYGYTEVDVPGRKWTDKPVYVLVNQRSFSAAEMFAFIIQMQKRGIIVGTKTAGGGHTVGVFSLGHGFSVNLPVGQVVDPGTQMGWEKAGIQPDIEVASNKCLETGYLIALENLIQQETFASEPFEVEWQMDILKSEIDPMQIEDTKLKSYMGVYGRRIVSYISGKLFYQGRAGIEKARMIPIDESTFRFSEVDFFRVRFVHDETGKITGMKGLYDDGYEDYSVRVQ